MGMLQIQYLINELFDSFVMKGVLNIPSLFYNSIFYTPLEKLRIHMNEYPGEMF